MPTSAPRAALAAALLLIAPTAAPAQQVGDVPFVPTPEPVVEAMLDLADVGAGDFVLDLGSGDGRIVVAAARDRGARALGVDLDPRRIAEARDAARQAGVTDRVNFVQGDLFDQDLSRADVLTMYLLPEVNLRLRPVILERMRPGARVVSHDFDMGEWVPDRQVKVPGDGSNVYLWMVPARVEGVWRLDAGDGGGPWRLDIRQHFQRLEATARRGGETVDLADAGVQGEAVSFTWPDGRRFLGRLGDEAGTMAGVSQTATLDGSAGWRAVRSGS